MLALQSGIVSKLNEDKLSPISGRVIMTGKRKTHDRCLTQTSLSEGLSKSKLIGTISREKFVAGPLASQDLTNLNASLKKATNVIEFSLNLFKLKMPDQALLAKLAVEDEEWLVRQSAVRKLADQTLVARIAIEDNHAGVRWAAVRNLKDQALLAKIAAEDEDKHVRAQAASRLQTLR